MKDFKVLVGMTEENMVEVWIQQLIIGLYPHLSNPQVLHAGLRNDSAPETFKLKHSNRTGIHFPSRYVKIVPLS